MSVPRIAQRIFRLVTATHVSVYRATGGRVGGKYRLGAGWRRPAPVLLLEHRGRRSGKHYVTPLIFTRDGEHLVLVASQGGLPTNPSWYHNLKDSPDTHIQIGGQRIPVHARVATADERRKLWPRVVEVFADYANYQTKTDRVLPLVIL